MREMKLVDAQREGAEMLGVRKASLYSRSTKRNGPKFGRRKRAFR
jgi:hypothetical protein